ncbi:hypothetical protein ANMWB30_23230 [Arthrobacter sp. MWB30]|nr:hypothetical protein ANMWB30_23230 [Arthrobacter sp. MWB30]
MSDYQGISSKDEGTGLMGEQPVIGEDPAVQRVGRVEPASPEIASESKAKQARRQRITAEDIEARFAARRDQRQARGAKRPVDLKALFRGVVVAVLGLGVIAFGLGISSAGEHHAAEVKSNNTKEGTLQGALARLGPEKASTDTAVGATPQISGDLAAARKRGDELAVAQQEFAAIYFAGNAEPSANNGTPKPSVLRALDHRKALAGFFAPGALVLTDAQAYSFKTEDLLAPGKIDPRMAWFTRYESPVARGATPQKVADPAGYAWKTASVGLSGTPGVMTVVWTNTDLKSGELLAWATARYSVDEDTFDALSVTTTTQGESQQRKADTTTPATAKGAKA